MDIAKKPHKVLFIASALIVSISGLSWKLNIFSGGSSDKGVLLESLGAILGAGIMTVPFYLIYGVIYFFMHYYNRPTDERLNAYHLLMLLIILILKSSYYVWELIFYNGLDNSNIFLIFLSVLSFLGFAIFAYNIITNIKEEPFRFKN